MKKILLYIFIIFFNCFLKAQDTTKWINLNEIVVSANKVEENKRFVAQQVQTISAPQIAFLNVQSSADLLAQTGNVMVQKSQQGGGSPILRGFEASRVLLVVDGVRMNNLIYRAGHLQNVVTIDQNILERVEVLYGPSSTVYGSDALGGVVHFRTKKPLLSTESGKILIKGSAFARYGTVNQEKAGHFDLNIGGTRLGSLSSITYSDFGDLKMGSKTQALDTLWGLRRYYSERINGKDSLVKNADPYLQKFSGFKQYDILQKFMFKPNETTNHILNFQFSNSTDVPRYDRLTDPKGAGLASSEWYYGPQKRLLMAYEFSKIDLKGFFNTIRGNLNFQDVEESRHNRNFGAEFRTSRIENVKVYGATVDFQHKDEYHDLRMGIEAQTNNVLSTAHRLSVINGSTSPQSTRYPSGDNNMTTIAAYTTHTWKINEALVLNDGIRLSQVNLKSTFTDKTFYNFPYNEAVQNVLGWSGNLGLVYTPQSDIKISMMGSSGFRVPNVDDMTKVFESTKGKVFVPNNAIKPEKTYNWDLSIAKAFNEKWSIEGTFFYTAFRDAIVADKFTFNGQDSIIYDGVKSAVYANQNKNKANILGVSMSIKAQITEGVVAYATYNYTKGRIKNSDGTDSPLDHIAPAFGRLGVQYYSKNHFQAEIFTNYSAWKRLEDYSNSGEDNLVYATPQGMPSWWTLNIRMGYAITDNVKLQCGMDNIFDVNYRVFASGIHGTGRNLFVTARYVF